MTELTDYDGELVQAYEYDAWGNATIYDPDATTGKEVDPALIANPFLYTGREWDSEIGLYYYRARHYAPQLGRFIQPDPIGYAGGSNLYWYVSNTPTSYSDPQGNRKKCCCTAETCKLEAYLDKYSVYLDNTHELDKMQDGRIQYFVGIETIFKATVRLIKVGGGDDVKPEDCTVVAEMDYQLPGFGGIDNSPGHEPTIIRYGDFGCVQVGWEVVTEPMHFYYREGEKGWRKTYTPEQTFDCSAWVDEVPSIKIEFGASSRFVGKIGVGILRHWEVWGFSNIMSLGNEIMKTKEGQR